MPNNKGKQERVEDLSVYPLLVLEEYFPRDLRHKIFHRLFPILSLLLMLIVIFIAAGQSLSPDDEVFAPLLRMIAPKVEGIFLLIFSFWIIVHLFESFYNAIYYHNRAYKLTVLNAAKRTAEGAGFEVSSEVASIFYNTRGNDIMKSFSESPLGVEMFLRCGLLPADVKEFLDARQYVFELTLDDMREARVITMEDFALFIFHNYPEFSEHLFKKGVGEKDFIGAVKWVSRVDEEIRFAERWWSRDNLAKLGSLGRDFAYGQTYLLDRYARDMTTGSTMPYDRELHWRSEVDQIEAALAKAKESNVIILSDDGLGSIDIVYELAHEIDARAVSPLLQDKRMLLVDTNLLMAAMKEKGLFEEQFIRMLNEAVVAGNIILVFDHFTSFVTGAHSIGSDVIDILNPYLVSSQIHVIALAANEEYHRILAPNGEMSARFEKVQVKEPESSKTLTLLEDSSLALERKYRVFFTFPAVVEVLRSAENYLTEGVLLDRATDLLMELPPYIKQQGASVIEKSTVLDFIGFKTKMPVGEIKGEEREKLEHLERELHKRIVGQDEAVVAISNSMRRSRAGVRDTKKPIGSFLFLGPTGVGKTETAKALAAVYFNDEKKMMRLDMSEYQGEDSLRRLIGSFEQGKPGTLTMLLKNSPYGVLLLDEFEKTSLDVQNLFLQVLDEGFFSDMGGHKVNARNIIFIATSNAGSDLMYQAIAAGDNVHALKQYIIDTIIKKGTLKPELMNRFDGVILFNPLEKEDLKQIARLMSESLKKRLKEEQQINLTINDALIEALMKEGTDPMFGGRPMARAVKDKIERVIADKIISGEVQTGATVELSAEDLV
jgi:ATP-dependent Clp protease ATP-binding subunit ClpC